MIKFKENSIIVNEVHSITPICWIRTEYNENMDTITNKAVMAFEVFAGNDFLDAFNTIEEARKFINTVGSFIGTPAVEKEEEIVEAKKDPETISINGVKATRIDFTDLEKLLRSMLES